MFQMTEVGVPQQMVMEILSLIARLRAPPREHEGREGQMRPATQQRCALMQSKQPVPPPRCRQMVGSNAVVHAVQDFLLSKTLKRAILASQSPRIRGMLA